LITSKEFRKRLARAIIIDRATSVSTSIVGRIARERSEENYRFAGNFVAGKRLLDIGGGMGVGHDLLLMRRATFLLSLDLHIASTAQGGDARVHSVQGDFLTYPLPDNSFDVIICLGTLFYLADPEAALKKMYRVLVPTGMLIINCINQELVRRYFGMPLEQIDEKFSVAYDEAGFRNLIRRHFNAEPTLYVQQPVPVYRTLLGTLAFWLTPLTWPVRRHPVVLKPPGTEGMYFYAIMSKDR
jgi:SAM-dependent methyltransferase